MDAAARAQRTAPPALMLSPAGYEDVALLDGPMLDQFRAQHAALLAMDEDALLKPLAGPRTCLRPVKTSAAGTTPSPASIAGRHAWVRFGQYVSSLASAHAVTGDEAMLIYLGLAKRGEMARAAKAQGRTQSVRS